MKNNPAKISFCIICMNRLHHLQQTFLRNIQDNADYQDLQFILLDYNSQDGMDLWAKENLLDHIADGRVVYYKTFEPQAFSHSHAKNLAFRLADGDIVCNINADHFTGEGFGRYVNDTFTIDEDIVLTPIDFHKTKKSFTPSKDVFGKVCVKKSNFLKVKGFDERMSNYGYEDYDFINRLEMLKVKRVIIEDLSFLKFITHDDEERYAMQKAANNIHAIYIQHCSPALSKIILLYKDNWFEMGALVDNRSVDADKYIYAYKSRNVKYESGENGTPWVKGHWKNDRDNLSIVFTEQSGNSFQVNIIVDNDQCILKNESKGMQFHRLSNESIGNYISGISHTFPNRLIMEENLKEKIVEVNPDGFGNALVFKNFNNHPLHLT